MAETTTDDGFGDGATTVAEPVEETQQAAAQPQEPAPTQPAQADETAAWLATKGIDTSDPEAIQKLAKMAQNSEKLMSKATNEASELKKSLAPSQPQQPAQAGQTDPMMHEFIQDYRRDKLISGFKEAHPDWAQHEPKMAEILNEASPSGYTYSQLVNAGLIGLDVVYTMAKSAAPTNVGKIRSEAQQEVLHTLANQQRAGGGTSHASDTNPKAPAEKDTFLKGFDEG